VEPLKSSDPSILGDWHIMGRLGEGGFGTVYLAEKGAQKAAIKVIKSEFVEEGDARARLATEAEVLSKLSNPYIGKILDSDVSNDLPWIATEFINGPTLDNKVKYEGPLTEIEWFNLAANLFHAIVAANELGVIHKDIKPSNIILGEMGNKLIDFGIAHIEGRTKTVVFGDREGSTPFSSPEHFTPRANPKMDVFSAAATLAFAAKGSGVWVGENDLQLMRSINDDAPNLEGLTQNQIEFLNPLFEKNPSDRLAASDALANALSYIEYFTQGQEGSKPRQIKTTSRKKSSLSTFRKRVAISGLTALLIVFVGLLTWKTDIDSLALFKNNDLLNTCKTNLEDGTLSKAVESCSSAVADGVTEAKLYLARAYKAQGSLDAAKTTLLDCKNTSLGCESDYAYFFETGNQAIEALKRTHEKGEKESAWRIGNLYLEKKFAVTALSWFEKGSAGNNPIANIRLASYWSTNPKNDFKKAISYAKLAQNLDLSAQPNLLSIKNPVERLLVSLYDKSNDDIGKIDFLTKCANERVAFCIYSLANTYLTKKDLRNASKWGKIGADMKDPNSMWVLARVAVNKNSQLAPGTKDDSIDEEIFRWYKQAAELGEVNSMSALGLGYSIGIASLPADFEKSCYWYQKAMISIKDRKGTYEEELADTENYRRASQFFELQSCQTILLGTNPALRFTDPTPSALSTKSPVPLATKKSGGVLASPSPSSSAILSDGVLQPALSYKTSEYSEKLSSNYGSTSIFGRAFLSDLLWKIPLTNSGSESVPPINRVQFRDSAKPFGSWWNMPYTLRDGGSTGWYAEVSDLGIQILHSSGSKVCPEFRFALVQGGVITYLWNKTVAPCTAP
jgi:serine/threonine protein kinase/TPR repeat protein